MTWCRGLAGASIVVILAVGCGDGDESVRVVDDDPTALPTAVVTAGPTTQATPLATATTTAAPPATVTATPTASASPTPTATASPVDATRFFGVYDGESLTSSRYEGWIGTVEPSEDGLLVVLLFDGHTYLGASGAPQSGGTVALEGGGRLEDDIVLDVVGSVTIEETGSRLRVAGEVHEPHPGFGFSARFRLERSTALSSSRFAGTYRVDFDPSPSGCECRSSATIVIAVDDGGFGEGVGPAVERDPSGQEIGTFDPDECLVSPTGRVRCRLWYETSLSGQFGWTRFGVTLTGVLGPTGGTGVSSGIIFPSATMLDGQWTAVRE